MSRVTSSLLVAAAAAAFFLPTASAATSLSVDVAPDGSYSIIFNGKTWFTSDVYAIHSNNQLLTSGNGGLKMTQAPTAINGQGAFGAYTGIEIGWNSNLFVTRFYQYAGLQASNPLIVFEQEFPQGLTGTGSNASDATYDLSTSFPTFGPTLSTLNTNLGYVAWADCMSAGHVGTWKNGGLSTQHFGGNGGVVGWFNQSGGSTLILSSLSDYMVSGPAFPSSLNQVFGAGFLAPIDGIPAGTKHQTILMSGSTGMNDTMVAWGDALLLVGNKQRTALDADFQTSYLSYWTDNGAYYYYNTEPNVTYEQTMLDVKSYWGTLNLPVRSFQFDSWWYFKQPNKGALLLWEPMPSYFPDQMEPWLGLPLALHNRYFAKVNNYTEMGFEFIVEESNPTDISLPIDVKMFTYIMTKAKEWGMTMYEQDWLITTYSELRTTQSNITAASTWLHAMGDAAEGLGVTIQYCMPLINHMLESTTIPVVTNARASGDYHPGTDQWDIGLSSLFYYAIGIQPSKDDFWTTDIQPGNPYSDNPHEPNWMLQAIMTTMSTGPVGPSDMVNGTNATLVMQTCRSGDGLLFRPDRPMITVDSAFLNAVYGADASPRKQPAVPQTAGEGKYIVGAVGLGDVTVPDVLLTYSNHGHGSMRWYYVVNVRLGNNYSMPFSDLGYTGDITQFAAIDWFNPSGGAVQMVDASTPLMLLTGQGLPGPIPVGAHSIRYHVLAPVLPGGWILMGEFDKITVMARQRTTNVTVNTTGSGGFSATVHSHPSESTVNYWVAVPSALIETFAAANHHNNKNMNLVTGAMPVVCKVANGVDATLTCAGNGCTCM